MRTKGMVMAKPSKSGGSKSHPQYRDTKTGEFIPKQDAVRMKPERVVKEQVPNPGHGDTGRGKKK
jgi:hypothetical protein